MYNGGSGKAAYNFIDFYNDCKNQRGKIKIETGAKNDAQSLLRLLGGDSLENQILDFLTSYKPDEFRFINSKEYRKGSENDKTYHPRVDAYILSTKWYDVYIAFYIQTTEDGWCIKSIHSDNSHGGNGDTISIGSYLDLTRKLI